MSVECMYRVEPIGVSVYAVYCKSTRLGRSPSPRAALYTDTPSKPQLLERIVVIVLLHSRRQGAI